MPHPITIAIAQAVGTGLLSDLISSFMPEPGRGAVGERVRATQSLLPQLQAAARGEPTVAAEAQIGRLGEEVTAYKQAYGAQARRQGVSRTIPGRGGMERLEAARIRGVADILGGQQTAARQQLIGMGAQALPMQRDIEVTRRAKVEKGLLDLAGLFSESKLEKEQGVRDERFEQMLTSLQEALMNLLKG